MKREEEGVRMRRESAKSFQDLYCLAKSTSTRFRGVPLNSAIFPKQKPTD